MDRREFLHITALGSAAGVFSFTGLGLVWEDAPGEEHSNSATASPSTDAPSTSATTPTTSTDDRDPTSTDADARTETDRPSTTEPSPTATETPSSATTETRPSATTPGPWREVDVRYRAYDENRKVYVNVENGNDYAVEVTVTISWGFEDGSETSETRVVELDAGKYWAGEVRADAGERSVESWGHQHTVETR